MFARSLNRLAMMSALGAALAGCGGDGDDPPTGGPAPAIVEFSADQPAYFIGDKATLTVRFSGGAGRIDPGIGAVQSGATVQTEALDGPRELRLVVESSAGKVSRSLRLPVQYRDRYRELATNFASRGHTASLAGDGSVLLIGGSRGQGTLSTSIDRFDPRSNTLLKVGDLRTGREGHRAVRLNSGRILVTGGNSGLPVTTAEVIDERTGAVSATGSPRVARTSHTATRFGNDKVLILGGYTSGEGEVFGISRSAEIWDPATNQFRLLPATMRMARAGHSATLLPDGRVLIVGGLSVDASYQFAEIFDPATETFSVVAAVDNRERGLHATAQLPDGTVLVLGGETEATRPVAWVTQFGGNGGTSQVLANLVQPRTLGEGALSRDGRVFLFGGEIGPGNVTTDTAEAFSPATGGMPIASLPGPRVGHTTTWLTDGRFLIAGGEDADGRFVPSVLLYE
jgi:N-acetylneuraminic acid mutarotase